MTEPLVVPQGQGVLIRATFRDTALPRERGGQYPLVNPTFVDCEVVAPDGTTAVLPTEEISFGVYQARVQPMQVGHYRGFMRGGGIYEGFQDFRFRVRSTAVA